MEHALRHRRQSGVLAQEIRCRVATAQQSIVAPVDAAAKRPIELLADQTRKRRPNGGARLRCFGDAADNQIDVVRLLIDRAQPIDNLQSISDCC